MLELLADPSLRRQVGDDNRHRIDDEFSPEWMCESYVRLIADGLGPSARLGVGRQAG
jgi:hypothetical protein